MKKTGRYTEVSSGDKMETAFLGEQFEFDVPIPTPEDDVIQHHWLGELDKEKVLIVLQWRAEIIDEQGMRIATGQSAVSLDDIYAASQQEAKTPTESPIKCYVIAPCRVEHDFSAGPMRLPCTIELENTSKSEKVQFDITFRKAVEAAAGISSNVQFTWTGFSEKKSCIGPQKKCQIKNAAIFTRPGTFDLCNFTVTDQSMPIVPRSHIIVVNDT